MKTKVGKKYFLPIQFKQISHNLYLIYDAMQNGLRIWIIQKFRGISKINQIFKKVKMIPSQAQQQLNSQQFKEEVTNFVVFVNTLRDKDEFKIKNPTIPILKCLASIWIQRKVRTVDKKITLFIIKDTDTPTEKQIAKLFVNFPGIIVNINGNIIQNAQGILKADEIAFYEGTLQQMNIFYKQNGIRYIGPVSEDLKPSGYGYKIEQSETRDRVEYRGEFMNGKKNGFGMQIKKNTYYQGMWQNNEKNGWGVERIYKKKKLKQTIKTESTIREEGDQEQSNLQQEKKEEQMSVKEESQSKNKLAFKKKFKPREIQKMLQKYKSIYQGPYLNGLKSGEDGCQYTKNYTYEGQWAQGAKNGQGTMKYKTGAVYKGSWKNNVIEGEGQYKDEAGNIYEGNFQAGIYSGFGKMSYTNGDVYQGYWLHGKKHTQQQQTGTYTYSDGDYYEGSWVKDAAEGKGKSMIDGEYYEGQFLKGQKHGYGQITDNEGDVITGIWKKNVIQKKISINGELVELQGQDNNS